ncbi:MAG: hypothetical protein Q4B73_03780 [Lachnospiraceae bacterium]|nr:hypothetical protein [Lachnospiraceae bacterium]
MRLRKGTIGLTFLLATALTISGCGGLSLPGSRGGSESADAQSEASSNSHASAGDQSIGDQSEDGQSAGNITSDGKETSAGASEGTASSGSGENGQFGAEDSAATGTEGQVGENSSADALTGEADPSNTEEGKNGQTSDNGQASNTGVAVDPFGEEILLLPLQIDSRDGAIRMHFPESWRDLTSEFDAVTDEAYLLKAGAYEEAVFLLASYESKSDSFVKDFEEFNDRLVRVIAENPAFTAMQVNGTQTITLSASGLEARRTRLSADYEDKSVVYWLYTMEDGNRYYQLTAWTTVSNVLKEEAIIQAAADSLEILK